MADLDDRQASGIFGELVNIFTFLLLTKWGALITGRLNATLRIMGPTVCVGLTPRASGSAFADSALVSLLSQ